MKSSNSDLNAPSIRKPCSQVFSLPSSPGHFPTKGDSSDGFFEIDVNLDNRENHSAESAERDSIRYSKFKCDDVVGPQNDSNDLLGKETVLTLLIIPPNSIFFYDFKISKLFILSFFLRLQKFILQ